VWAEGNKKKKQISFQSLTKYSNSDSTSLYSTHYHLEYNNQAGLCPTCVSLVPRRKTTENPSGDIRSKVGVYADIDGMQL